ncbi:hypothetical protein OROGR_018770 [Orobanche gracilis]
MAQEMDDLEFLLPSELLTDDDLLTDFSCGFGNPSILSSDLSSPVESVTDTLETGRDEEDFISELTRKLTHPILRASNLSYDYPTKAMRQSGSPQSTLCGFQTDSGSSPNSSSRVCSPQEAKDALSWDLLYAAAEEVARIRMVEETAAFYSTKPYPPTEKPNSLTMPQQKPDRASGFYSNQAQIPTHLPYHHLQAAMFQQRKQQQRMMMMMKNRVMGQGSLDYQLQNGSIVGGRDGTYGLSVSTWPTSQKSLQHTGCGTKPVFLCETGLTKERVGTGVFMPRRFASNPTETRKRPDRVVRALNVNMDSIDAQVCHRDRGVGNFTADYEDAVMKQRNNVMLAHHQKRKNQEFILPQDWSY